MPRYFKIPEPVVLEGSNDGDGNELVITWQSYHHLAVWTDDAWLESQDKADVQLMLMKAFRHLVPGTEVGINDDAFDIYQPIAKRAVPRFAATNLMHAAAFSNRVHFLRNILKPPSSPETDAPAMLAALKQPSSPETDETTTD
jgi:hypothetical protein